MPHASCCLPHAAAATLRWRRAGRRAEDRSGGGDIFSRIEEERSERHGWRSTLAGPQGAPGGRAGPCGHAVHF